MDSIGDYVRSVLGAAALDADTERELALQARQGDCDAREVLITSGMRHVVMRARMLGFSHQLFGDAVQAGAVGLIRAVDRFDPDRGARLSTFAWWWIGDAMKSVVQPAVEPLPMDVPQPESDHVELPIDVPEVLALRFGVGEATGSMRTRREVARLLGCSISKVRRLEARAMRDMRRGLAKVGHRAPAGEPIPHSSIGRAFDC